MTFLTTVHPNDSIATPASFRDSWSFADSEELARLVLGRPGSSPREDADWKEAYHNHMQKLAITVGCHILHVAQTRGLTLPPYAEYVDHPFLVAWRAAAAGQPVTRWQALSLGKPLFQSLLTDFRVKVQTKDVLAGHQLLQETVERGDFDAIMVSLYESCAYSGEKLSVGFSAWEPKLIRYDRKTRNFLELGPGDIQPPRLHEATIPCPSGRLLLFDNLRGAAWSELLDLVRLEDVSVNYAQGRIETTRNLAESLGIARVYVGNTCPSVVTDGETVRVGRLSEEAEGQEAGYITTDLWWVTAVDYQVLHELMEHRLELSSDEAREAVASLLEDADVVEVSLTPGDYTLYYTDQPETFGRLFDRQVDWQGMEEPMLILSRTALEPVAKREGRLKP